MFSPCFQMISGSCPITSQSLNYHHQLEPTKFLTVIQIIALLSRIQQFLNQMRTSFLSEDINKREYIDACGRLSQSMTQQEEERNVKKRPPSRRIRGKYQSRIGKAALLNRLLKRTDHIQIKIEHGKASILTSDNSLQVKEEEDGSRALKLVFREENTL